ncbi:MAG: hypothetical protein AAGH19_05545, partial [Pseudomonadota bacterium]
MSRPPQALRRLGLLALGVGVLAVAVPAPAQPISEPDAALTLDLAALDSLTAEERYRQLSLMLLVTAGVDQPLYDVVARAVGLTAGQSTIGAFDPSRYTAPLARIVDQASLLAGAERLFAFSLANRSALRARLDALEASSEAAAFRDTQAGMTEDTILIRTAIADSLSAAGLDEAGHRAERRYREQTVVLRNALEYVEFKVELDRLTEQAIASVGGKLDAYQRMFDVETNTGVLDRRIRSAE